MAVLEDATPEAIEVRRDGDTPSGDEPRPPDHGASRRRLTIAALIGLGVAAVPYLWVRIRPESGAGV